MPLLLLILGALFIVTAIRGNQNDVATQLESDLIGSGSQPGFFVWIGAIIALAVFGEVADLKTASKVFIGLLVVVYTVAQNGFFAQFAQAFKSVQITPTNAAAVGGSSVIAGQTTTPTPSSAVTLPSAGGTGLRAAAQSATQNQSILPGP